MRRDRNTSPIAPRSRAPSRAAAPCTIDAGAGGTPCGRYRATVQLSQHDFDGSGTGRETVAATEIDNDAAAKRANGARIFMASPENMQPATVAVNDRGRIGGAALALLAVVTALAAARDPTGLSRFVLGFAYRGVAVDERSWQEWADANAPFFGSLALGARFAIVEDVSDSTGIIFTREASGVKARKTHFLRFRPVPMVLAAPPPIAAEIQTLRMARDGNRFWDGLKNLARRRAIHCYRFASRDEMERLGLEAFLRNIDVYDADAPGPHH